MYRVKLVEFPLGKMPIKALREKLDKLILNDSTANSAVINANFEGTEVAVHVTMTIRNSLEGYKLVANNRVVELHSGVDNNFRELYSLRLDGREIDYELNKDLTISELLAPSWITQIRSFFACK